MVSKCNDDALRGAVGAVQYSSQIDWIEKELAYGDVWELVF